MARQHVFRQNDVLVAHQHVFRQNDIFVAGQHVILLHCKNKHIFCVFRHPSCSFSSDSCFLTLVLHTKQQRCVMFVLFYYQVVEVQNIWITHITVSQYRYWYKVMVNQETTWITNSQIILIMIKRLTRGQKRRKERYFGSLYCMWIAVQFVLQIDIEVNNVQTIERKETSNQSCWVWKIWILYENRKNNKKSHCLFKTNVIVNKKINSYSHS